MWNEKKKEKVKGGKEWERNNNGMAEEEWRGEVRRGQTRTEGEM